MPAADRTVPGRSRWAWSGSAVFGVSTSAATKETTADTAVTTNVDCQPQNSSRPPATSMPMTAPDTENADQVATALPRWLAGNTAVIVDRVPGMIIAAPTPITTRQAIRNAVEVAKTAARAATRTRRCPPTARCAAPAGRRAHPGAARGRRGRRCSRRRSTSAPSSTPTGRSPAAASPCSAMTPRPPPAPATSTWRSARRGGVRGRPGDLRHILSQSHETEYLISLALSQDVVIKFWS